MIHRGYRYELTPLPAQAARLRAWVGTVRFVYNLCLEQRRDFWRQYQRQTGRALRWAAQSREVTDLRAEVDWIAEVPRVCLEQAIRDLDSTYARFFEGRCGYPRPRVKGENDTMRFQRRDVLIRRLNAKWSAARLPGIGWVKFRDTRPRRGELRNVTVALRAGRWSINFTHEIEVEARAPLGDAVGIDRGIAQTLTLSTGEHFNSPSTVALTQRRKRAQRVLARRKRGSKRRTTQRARVARLAAKMARVRRDWAHRTSTDIASRFGLVAIEALKITSMTASIAGTIEKPGRNVGQKAGLNRSILEQSWGQWATLLAYKLEERGGVLISVPAAYSSQTCASCGVVDARSRKSQAVFACVHCDHTDNADVNAAREILRRSTALLGGEGALRAPAEPPIMAAA